MMDPAVAAVVGAGLGAGATILGSLLAARQQAAQRQIADVRQRKEAAYSAAIRSLLRARNRRSGFTDAGVGYIGKEEVGTFFDDLVDAPHWLAVLTTACGAKQRLMSDRASATLNEAVDQMIIGRPRPLSKKELSREPVVLSAVYEDVLAAAREDLGPHSA